LRRKKVEGTVLFKLALIVLTLLAFAVGYCVGKSAEHRDGLKELGTLASVEGRIYTLEVRLNNLERQ
jgi:hypothetical protein